MSDNVELLAKIRNHLNSSEHLRYTYLNIILNSGLYCENELLQLCDNVPDKFPDECIDYGVDDDTNLLGSQILVVCERMVERYGITLEYAINDIVAAIKSNSIPYTLEGFDALRDHIFNLDDVEVTWVVENKTQSALLYEWHDIIINCAYPIIPRIFQEKIDLMREINTTAREWLYTSDVDMLERVKKYDDLNEALYNETLRTENTAYFMIPTVARSEMYVGSYNRHLLDKTNLINYINRNTITGDTCFKGDVTTALIMTYNTISGIEKLFDDKSIFELMHTFLTVEDMHGKSHKVYRLPNIIFTLMKDDETWNDVSSLIDKMTCIEL